MSWGSVHLGGDSSAVQVQLKNVQRIHSSDYSFAAIRGDGSVVTWGDPASGGDSSTVQERLNAVQQIQSTDSAFAAILQDGSVVTWGDAYCGGDSGAVQERLKNVEQIQATGSAFAAILADGSVVTWVTQSAAVTAALYKSGYRTYDKFKPQALRSLPSWVMICRDLGRPRVRW